MRQNMQAGQPLPTLDPTVVAYLQSRVRQPHRRQVIEEQLMRMRTDAQVAEVVWVMKCRKWQSSGLAPLARACAQLAWRIGERPPASCTPQDLADWNNQRSRPCPVPFRGHTPTFLYTRATTHYARRTGQKYLMAFFQEHFQKTMSKADAERAARALVRPSMGVVELPAKRAQVQWRLSAEQRLAVIDAIPRLDYDVHKRLVFDAATWLLLENGNRAPSMYHVTAPGAAKALAEGQPALPSPGPRNKLRPPLRMSYAAPAVQRLLDAHPWAQEPRCNQLYSPRAAAEGRYEPLEEPEMDLHLKRLGTAAQLPHPLGVKAFRRDAISRRRASGEPRAVTQAAVGHAPGGDTITGYVFFTKAEILDQMRLVRGTHSPAPSWRCLECGFPTAAGEVACLRCGKPVASLGPAANPMQRVAAFLRVAAAAARLRAAAGAMESRRPQQEVRSAAGQSRD